MEGDIENGQVLLNNWDISIHALRVEGDVAAGCFCYGLDHFYPRPPGGGRQQARARRGSPPQFLSTPSGWRATGLPNTRRESVRFLSTPSGWRATPWPLCRRLLRCAISIHALRVEGDLTLRIRTRFSNFISIHALRVEGDSKNGQSFCLFLRKREKNLPL